MRTPAERSFSHGGAWLTRVTRSSKSARSTGVATRSASAVIRRRRFGFSAAHTARNVSSAPLPARPSVNLRAKSVRWSNRIWRPAIVAQKRCSSSSRNFGSTRCHSRWITASLRATSGVTGTSHGAGESCRRARRCWRRRGAGVTLRAFAVEVRVEQRVERDHAVVVRRALGDEVDDDARFLARMHAHDPADALLVDAARGRRREVEADGGARRVPALGEELGVDQDVDLAALVGGERLGELHRRRLAGDRLGLDPGGAELLREVVGVLDAGRVDDAGRRPEALAVEARGRLVEGGVVERCREGALLEVAADDRHRVDRGGGRHPQAPQRRDQAPAGRVGQRQVVDRGREDVRDLLRDQLLRRRHADVDRLAERPDRGARLLAERRVGLVADHELVRAARDLGGMAREPGVRLDRDRVVPQRLHAGVDRVGEALGVALGREVARELGDEQAAMGEDQDAEVLGGLDEPGRGDRLAGRGRVAEAVAARGARILALERGRLVVEIVVDHAGVEVVVLLVQLGRIGLDRVGRCRCRSRCRSRPTARWLEAISSVSMPASASIWCRRRSVPEAVAGLGDASTRSSPSISP